MNLNDFLTWDVIATYAGATVVTALIVQFTKGLVDRLVHIPTQVYSYLVALLVLYAGFFFTGQLTASSAVLILFNGILVAVASNGAYEGVGRLKGK